VTVSLAADKTLYYTSFSEMNSLYHTVVRVSKYRSPLTHNGFLPAQATVGSKQYAT